MELMKLQLGTHAFQLDFCVSSKKKITSAKVFNNTSLKAISRPWNFHLQQEIKTLTALRYSFHHGLQGIHSASQSARYHSYANLDLLRDGQLSPRIVPPLTLHGDLKASSRPIVLAPNLGFRVSIHWYFHSQLHIILLLLGQRPTFPYLRLSIPLSDI